MFYKRQPKQIVTLKAVEYFEVIIPSLQVGIMGIKETDIYPGSPSGTTSDLFCLEEFIIL